jgi:predicted MFS family arabinose efflux permease
VLAVAAAVMGSAVPMANVTTTRQIAAVTSGEERTLAMMSQASVVNGASTAGLVTTGVLVSALGPRPVLALGGLVVAAAAALTGLRSATRERLAPDEPTRIQGRPRPTTSTTPPVSTVRRD